MTWSRHWRLECGDSGVVAPGPWLWLRALLWAALLFGFSILAFFAALRMPVWVRLPPGSDYACAIIVPALAVFAYAVAVHFAERRGVRELTLRAALFELPGGFIIGLTLISAVLLLLWVLGLYQVGWGHWRHWFFYFVFNSYVSAVLEELAFRAILLRLVARVFGPVTGLIISSLLFGLAHATYASFVASAQIAVVGLVFGALYMKSGKLWLAIGAHLGYDFTEWSLMGVGDKSGLLVISPAPHASVVLTGGTFGPDGSVLMTLVALSFVAAIVFAGDRMRDRSKRA